VVQLELIDAEPGASLTFDEVLLVAEGATSPSVRRMLPGNGDGRGYRTRSPRQDSHHRIPSPQRMRHAGHRQWYTDVRITGIKG
jgi:large subunit ribosomal protein L21